MSILGNSRLQFGRPRWELSWRRLAVSLTISTCLLQIFHVKTDAAPASYESQFAEGLKSYEKGDLKRAERLMKQIMKVNPEKPAMEAQYAYLLNDLEKFDQSIPVFKHVLQLDPNLINAQFRLGDAYLSTGQFPLAETQYQKVVDKIPDNIDAWNNLSVSLSQQRKFSEAKHAAVMAIRIDKNAHSGWDNLGGAEFLLGDIPAAKKAYEQALYVDPKRPDAQKIRDLLKGLPSAAASTGNSDNYAVPKGESQFRWPTNRVLTVCIMPANQVPHYSPKYADLLRQSFEQWSTASKGTLKFSFIPDPVLADILVRYSADPKEWVASNEGGHCDTFTKKGVPDKAAITLLTVSSNENIPLSDEEAHRTALHEIGHSIGIREHSHNSKDIMYSFVEPNLPATLTSRDAKTIQLMYPTHDQKN